MKKLFTDSKLRIVIASAVTIILIILSFLPVIGVEMSAGQLALLLLLSVAAGILIAMRFKFSGLGGIVMLIAIPILALCAMEFYTHVPWDLTFRILMLNIFFFYILYAICTFLLGSSRWGFVLATVVPMLFGLVNYFVVSFRGSPIVPWDIFSIGTAASITDNYEFTFTYRLTFVLFAFIYLLILSEKTVIKIKSIKVRLAALVLSFVCMFGYATALKTDAVKETFALDDILFTPNVLYRNNGFMVSFLSNIRYIDVVKPEGYSPEVVKKKQEEIEKSKTTEAPAKDIQDLPNIVVIMNEAFSDLAVNGEFETNEDYMPFIRSMKENTIKGNLFVSVKGGNTANTEFEFLTGSTMAFLPVGSIAYQQFVKSSMPSMASYLKGMGYSTKAIHPFYSSGWNRDIVYPYLGFDDFYSVDDFVNPKTIRSYVSDEAAYDKVIELYENKSEDEKLFAFEVTMQNHGGYSTVSPGFEYTIDLTQFSESEKTTSILAAEKYLTLIQESDRAFEELVNYFSDQDEDTIVVMFGDHQPADYITDTISKKINNLNPESSIELMQNGYTVPMVMWANYDIPEQQIDKLSVNYLSTLLYEQAGIPLTDYQLFLQELQKELPVITGLVHIDKNGKYYENSDETYKDLLNQYSIMQYNYLRDTKNRVADFFGG